MVNKVTNLNIKSFNDYTGPNEEFKRVNLVFGYNGRGKTSLAKGIIDVYMKQTGKEEGYRLYNKRFIRENILLEEGNTEAIKGVIANFGKHDIEIENEIREKQSKIEDVETLRGEIDSLKQRIRKEIDEIHDRRKGSSGIQKKPSSKTIWEVISLYNADYENAMKLVAKEEKLRSAKGDDSFEKRLLGIESTSIPKLMIPSEKNVREIENIFNTSFDDIAIPRIINQESPKYRRLLSYATTFIGGRGKKFGYISNEDCFKILKASDDGNGRTANVYSFPEQESLSLVAERITEYGDGDD